MDSLIVISVSVDDKGLAFLDDLEYLTPLNDPPPHNTKIPTGSYVSTAEQLDNMQLESFAVELQSLFSVLDDASA
jgi:hypothetical protein